MCHCWLVQEVADSLRHLLSHPQRLAPRRAASVGHLAAVMHRVNDQQREAAGVSSQEILKLRWTLFAWAIEIGIGQRTQDVERRSSEVCKCLADLGKRWIR